MSVSDVPESVVVEAAGGVVLRTAAEDGTVEVLLVHRPRYDDWSLPKGKLDDGESHEAAALREVEEETGFRCELGQELSETRYTDPKGRPKRVRYWMMTPMDGRFEPHREVDDIRWLPAGDAVRSLSYTRDAAIVDEAVAAWRASQ
jgi:8-oxo-dGTP diphosphatase